MYREFNPMNPVEHNINLPKQETDLINKSFLNLLPAARSLNWNLTAEVRNAIVDLLLVVKSGSTIDGNSSLDPEFLQDICVRALCDRGYYALLLLFRDETLNIPPTGLKELPTYSDEDIHTLVNFPNQPMKSSLMINIILGDSDVVRRAVSAVLSLPPSGTCDAQYFWEEAVESAMEQSARERDIRRRTTSQLLEEVKEQFQRDEGMED